MRPLLAFLIMFVIFGCLGFSYAADRVALVIGNADYPFSPLKNAVNDAQDMREVFENHGFDVIFKPDADYKSMLVAIDVFSAKLKDAKVGVFFFAGHGMQISGDNYLIPVDSHITSETDVIYAAVPVGRILGKMEVAQNPTNIVILDACRDNPFERRFRTTRKGLARMEAPVGSILAYATAPGSVAADGSERNGVYTKYLKKNIAIPGLSLTDIFMNVRKEVINETKGKQVPWEESSLTGRFYFSMKKSGMDIHKNMEMSDPETGAIWIEPVTGMEFVWIPNGCFFMGQSESEKQIILSKTNHETYASLFKDELPQHKVCLDGFWMGKYEVTQKEFRLFVQETAYETDAERDGAKILNKETKWKWENRKGYYWKNPGYDQTDDHPVVCISWNDITMFIKWLEQKAKCQFFLPTEAQWEYVAREGESNLRYWGKEDKKACLYANVGNRHHNWSDAFPCDDGYEFTSPKGSYKPNAFGIYDILGNVWEWCEDVYDRFAYERHVEKNPVILSGGSQRVLRGGGWDDPPVILRTSVRDRYFPNEADSNLGFRLTRRLR